MDVEWSTELAGQRTEGTMTISVEVSNKQIRWLDFPFLQANEIACRVGSVDTPEKMALQLARIVHIAANFSEENGGLMLHGALAERKGIGVILAGPGGVGKTTAGERLPAPWRILSDDTALIVKAPDGRYWAHPWPTWSRFKQGDMRGSWDVQAAVELELICMLSRGKTDRVFQLPIRQAISELVDVSGQSFVTLANGLSKGAFSRINLMRFHNAVAISKKIPVCRLEVSQHGEFWEKIEEFLGSLKKRV